MCSWFSSLRSSISVNRFSVAVLLKELFWMHLIATTSLVLPWKQSKGWSAWVHNSVTNMVANPLMRDDVKLFLVTSKRDLVVKISREFKRNIVKHVCWKFYKMKNRQNDSNNLVLIPTKPRFGVERKFCDVILYKCYFQQTCSICTIFLLNSCEIFTTKSCFDVTRKRVTSSRIRAIKIHTICKWIYWILPQELEERTC